MSNNFQRNFFFFLMQMINVCICSRQMGLETSLVCVHSLLHTTDFYESEGKYVNAHSWLVIHRVTNEISHVKVSMNYLFILTVFSIITRL